MKQKAFYIAYVLVFLNILIIQISFAQLPQTDNQKDYRAVLWSSADGLSLGKKNIMLKDVNGFLWIISPVGLNRFDGSNFKIYYTDNTKPGTINGSYSFSLVEDSLHNIWIGTNKGLSRYDIKNDTFKNFSTELPSITSVASIIPFWATRDELYCMESGYRITVYNIHSFEKKILATLDKNGPAMNHITIPESIYDAASNSIWILFGEYGKPGGGLLQVALSEKKVIRHEWNCYKKIRDHSHYSYGMRYDSKRKSIWLNTVEGLIEFTIRDKQFHEIAACNELMNLDNYEMIAGIELDASGKVLLYRYSKGIIVYDPVTQEVQPLFSDPDLQHEVSDENMSIYCDRDGMIWCGYLPDKGIYQLIPFTPAVSRIAVHAELPVNRSTIPVLHMIQAGTQIWVSTVDALNIFDPGSNSLKRLNTQDFHGLKSGNIVPLGADSISQKAWVTTWNPGTFYEVDMQTRICRNLPVKDVNHKEIFNVYPNEKTASKYKNGLIFLIDNMGIFTVTKDSAIVQQVLSIPYHINGMAVAAEKRIFLRLHFANTNLSYYETNGKWVQTATAVDSIEWSCIFYDSADQSYWVGGVKQLYHFDSNFRLIRRYTDKDGLPGTGILSIIKDDIGNIWSNTSQGYISRVNTKSGILTVLSEKDGYKKQDFRWQTPQFKDRNGDVYFAGVDGIDRISPNKLDLFPPSIVYLQSLEVNQHPPSLKTGINDLKEISLKYFENTILIETGVIDYYSKGKNSIRYNLEGVNDTWQYAPANYLIRFEKLSPGKHRLLIQSSTSGGNFNGEEKSLLIIINPAFWNTWWFRTITVGCIFVLFYTLIRFRLRQKFLLRLERSDKERQLAELRQRTAELEMQALRAQMNPHFIFNSLNSINRFILQNNKSKASEYLTKFSKLVRMILQNSQAESITLESELEALQLYLELEAVRFDHHFEFKINIAGDLETNVIKVPPLIIQPYTENAIWHGLMHKEEKGHLEIKLYQEEEVLCCIITDDGIGRRKAAELKSKSASTHKSMGMQITASRIEMMKQKKQIDTYIKITDLVFADGSVGGTEVLLKIPVQYD